VGACPVGIYSRLSLDSNDYHIPPVLRSSKVSIEDFDSLLTLDFCVSHLEIQFAACPLFGMITIFTAVGQG